MQIIDSHRESESGLTSLSGALQGLRFLERHRETLNGGDSPELIEALRDIGKGYIQLINSETIHGVRVREFEGIFSSVEPARELLNAIYLRRVISDHYEGKHQ